MKHALVAASLLVLAAAGAASAQTRTGPGGYGQGQAPGYSQGQGQGYGQGAAPGPAAAAPAPPVNRGPMITLYQLPNYQGEARSFSAGVDNLADQGFNDLAQSARIQGRWQVCEDAHMRGRCVELSGDVPNLAALRLTVAISSFENLDRPQAPASRYGGGFPGTGTAPGFGDRGGSPYDDRNSPYGGGPFAGPSLDGATASFFPRPAPGPYRTADEFCGRLGFTAAIYADDRGPDLRDVVCRR